jgi:hypothetical protein
MVSIYTIMVAYIKDKFTTIKQKVKENIMIFLKGIFMKVTGKMTFLKVMVDNNFRMGPNMKDSLKMV